MLSWGFPSETWAPFAQAEELVTRQSMSLQDHITLTVEIIYDLHQAFVLIINSWSDNGFAASQAEKPNPVIASSRRLKSTTATQITQRGREP